VTPLRRAGPHVVRKQIRALGAGNGPLDRCLVRVGPRSKGWAVSAQQRDDGIVIAREDGFLPS